MLRDVEWEVVSGISGVISAVVALISFGNLALSRKRQKTNGILGAQPAHYLLFCSGWVLLVISYNWCFEPFGPFIMRHDEKKLYGAMLGVPALMVTLFAFKKLNVSPPEKKNDAFDSQTH